MNWGHSIQELNDRMTKYINDEVERRLESAVAVILSDVKFYAGWEIYSEATDSTLVNIIYKGEPKMKRLLEKIQEAMEQKKPAAREES